MLPFFATAVDHAERPFDPDHNPSRPRDPSPPDPAEPADGPIASMDTNMEDVGRVPTELAPVNIEPATVPTLDGWIESLMQCKQLAEADVQRLCEKVRLGSWLLLSSTPPHHTSSIAMSIDATRLFPLPRSPTTIHF